MGRRWIATVLAVVVGLGALTGASALAAGVDSAVPTDAPTPAEAASADLPAPASIDFGACSAPDLVAAGAECGFLTVPLDWSKPAGTTVRIAVSRVRHTVTQARYQGIMVANPGGPGGSGLRLATLGSRVPDHAGDAYDWIGFDPRGVGSSVPRLSCQPTYFAGPRPAYEPTTPAIERTWLDRSKNYTAACSRAGALLDHITTEDVARDMDYLRAALGQPRLNYLGFSYGTYLGQVYSTLFPHHLRRMVLDSTVDPGGVWYQDNLDQDVAFDKTVDIWFDWVARYDDVYHLGATRDAVKNRWYQEKANLAAHPAGGVIGADEWNDLFLYAGYYQTVWTDLGTVFSRWVNQQDLTTLKAAYDDYVGPADDNEFAVYAAVQCTDVAWPTDWSTWRAGADATSRRAPFETWANTWYNAPCLTWPARAHQPVRIDGSKTSSVLMIDETLDAATPYPGSLHVRGLYPRASLIAEPGGTTHAGTLNGNTCVDGQIADYLATGRQPARVAGNGPDATCAPRPQPVPTAAAMTARATDPTGAGREAVRRILAQLVMIPR